MKKGFTLIELLVVIAIIGILASIVLVSLGTARNKAKDVAFKADLSGLRAAAELYASDNNESYLNFCTFAGGDALRVGAGIASAGGTMVCDSDVATAWAACAQLKSVVGDYFCVDWKGIAKQATGTCAAALIATGVCP